MAGLIWAGTAVSLAGLAAILWCVLDVWRARRAGLPDQALRARLRRAVAVNLAAFLVSALGLMLVLLGVMLG
jgi:hypothetical protein